MVIYMKQVKELIPMDEMGVLVSKTSEKVLVDSRLVATIFEKRHDHVCRNIEKLISIDTTEHSPKIGEMSIPEEIYTESGLSNDFVKDNFISSTYSDSYGRKQKNYLLTRDGFTVLAMGFTGKKAMQFKEAYIKRFNEMESKLDYIRALRDQYPKLTDAIKEVYDDPKFYVYTNEADMLNRIAFGMTSKQFREVNNIPKPEPIRPHLDSNSAALLDHLQHVDVGLIYGMLDYQERKQKLEWCAMKWKEKHLETVKVKAIESDVEINKDTDY